MVNNLDNITALSNVTYSTLVALNFALTGRRVDISLMERNRWMNEGVNPYGFVDKSKLEKMRRYSIRRNFN